MKTKKVVSSLAAVSFLFLMLGFYPGISAEKEKYEEKFQKIVPLTKDGKLFLSNIAGDIEVKTWDKAEVKIDALKISKATSLEKAKENVSKVKIEITEEGSTLRIETKYPKIRIRSLNVSVKYWLFIPSMASANVDSVSGDLTLEKIGGTVKAETVSGDVSLNDIAGTLKAKSVSGDVEVFKADKGANCNSVSGDLEIHDVIGDVDVGSVSGDVTVERIKGSIEAETVSGEIELLDVTDAKVIKAETVSGSVKYIGKIYADGRYYLKSHSGSINMIIPSDSAFDLEANTFSGDIETDFDITVSGKISRKKLSGSVNGGGAEIVIKTFSGDVYLKKS